MLSAEKLSDGYEFEYILPQEIKYYAPRSCPVQKKGQRLLNYTLYSGYVESEFVWQNFRCWQDILTSTKFTFLTHCGTWFIVPLC